MIFQDLVLSNLTFEDVCVLWTDRSEINVFETFPQS